MLRRLGSDSRFENDKRIVAAESRTIHEDSSYHVIFASLTDEGDF